ncbi:probable apyrase 6 isoform X2 [Mercurialis annua]|uniref:probable apyrase 6 isoform X2 n=1 Tax=Mercurialis annua TaxID=3986 RepID=UPI002160E908|nr:probable apyrase 6 isoform X2 [Mercurialis annua]
MRRSHARTRVDSNPPTNNTQMDPIKLQIRPSSRSKTKSNSAKSTLYYISLASLFTLVAFLSFYFIFKTNDSNSLSHHKTYRIIIDGGSTGTRIHVFSYSFNNEGRPVFDSVDGAMKVNPGLSSFSEDPESAGVSLEELLEFGKRRVPETLWGETEIRLMATAGMRLLDLKVQHRILESCRIVLRSCGFKFQDDWASVISGVYAWVTANYALGTLGGDPAHTTGIIELGGASAQVTFVSNEPVPPEFSRSIKFGNITYSIYSHSFLHFGQNAAFEALRESHFSVDQSAQSLEKGTTIDPCTPKGYLHVLEPEDFSPGSTERKHLPSVHSGGNFSECRSAALSLIQKGKDKCTSQQCYIGSTFTPKLQGKFLATENFFYTSKFFGLVKRAFLSDLILAGEQFCGEDWSRLRKKHHSLDDEDLRRYCFSSAYIVALLHDSLGIALDDTRISYANEVGNTPLDWALGAFILQSTASLDVQHSDWITTIISNDSPTMISLIAIAILLMFVAWSISKWRKPQLKTVYDLEKGRYIITRVGRS